MSAYLNHLIVVQSTICSGLLEDGPLALSLQLGIGEALLLELRWNRFVFFSLYIHHVMYCTGIKPTVQALADEWYQVLHPQTHMTPATAPPTHARYLTHIDPLQQQPMHDQWQ